MHKIQNFDIDKQCNKYVDEQIINRLKDLQKEYNENKSDENFYKLIYNIPSGFILTARLVTNYRALKTIYSQRKTHRLPE
jgi:tryptophan synthase beta subunit